MAGDTVTADVVDEESSPRRPSQVSKMPHVAPQAAPAIEAREIAALLLLVVLGDLTLYRGAGYAGLALLTLATPLLLLLGSPRPALKGSIWLVGGMLALLALRLAWLGSVTAVVIGAALILAYSLALHGARPYITRVIARGFEVTIAGGFALANYVLTVVGLGPRLPRHFGLNVLLPLAVLALFGTLFVFANPDLANSVWLTATNIFQQIESWTQRFSEHVGELAVWLAVAWIGAGLIRPFAVTHPVPSQPRPIPPDIERQETSPYYVAVRNMLLGVIGLFAIYLAFEFATLWFREFPAGFYYAGYAHEGAAWITAALALATLVLSLSFRGTLLRDPRSKRLRTLAWIWSAENLLLAMAVYNRMHIYIDFNGMTWMRTVGLFGISTVLVGFGLVVWKIVHNRDFAWLIQRQLWALAGAVYLFVLMPVDTVVHTYNVRQVMAGDLAPSVQISVHPISAEGYLVLQPLTQCDDATIRDGVRAMLAERFLLEQNLAAERVRLGWTSRQLGDELLLDRLRAASNDWQPYLDDARRQAALEAFHKYAYQWY